tara:strand:+ start:529 stop:792 length:264 start_codon:yes stop_codon:yes gene_type:complete
MAHENIRLLAASTTVTGSIQKLYAGAAAALEDVTFGKYVEGGTNVEYSYTATDVTIAAGSYLEGPIIQMKTKTAPIVCYFNGSLKSS